MSSQYKLIWDNSSQDRSSEDKSSWLKWKGFTWDSSVALLSPTCFCNLSSPPFPISKWGYLKENCFQISSLPLNIFFTLTELGLFFIPNIQVSNVSNQDKKVGHHNFQITNVDLFVGKFKTCSWLCFTPVTTTRGARRTRSNPHKNQSERYVWDLAQKLN